MKIRVISDVHLEFGDYDPGEGDVLILAGDIVDAVAYLHRCDKEYKDRYDRFFNKCAENYNKVFYVMGNHEHYNCAFYETPEILKENLPENISLLNNTSEFYNGVHFVGATTWTGFQGKEENKIAAEQGLNDYRYIFKDTTYSHPIDADFIEREHNNSVEWLNQCLPTLRGDIVMISHHAPSFRSIDADYVDRDTVTAYASDLTKLIKEIPNLKLWVHGHIHSSKDYFVGKCRVICNPRGYHGEDENLMFNPQMQIKLNEDETNSKEDK